MRPWCAWPGWADHPRMRGEHVILTWCDRFKAGSPPHARGAHSERAPPLDRQGLTPACAGSTPPGPPALHPSRAHPRMRGEHTRVMQEVLSGTGSPPHARGAHQGSAADRPRAGITPACAGSTCRPHEPEPRSGDHPRMRGEHQGKTSVLNAIWGSPPHARGARLDDAGGTVCARITPACAGSTIGWPGTLHGGTDHPRMRGEHDIRVWPNGYAIGSPPHARGARCATARPVQGGGITPACAGSTVR